MVNYRRSLLAGGSYFFTRNLAERRLRLLTDHIDLLRAAFRYARARHPFTVDAIVVLPDHLHAIFSLPEGDADYALRLRLIKTRFSHYLSPYLPSYLLPTVSVTTVAETVSTVSRLSGFEIVR